MTTIPDRAVAPVVPTITSGLVSYGSAALPAFVAQGGTATLDAVVAAVSRWQRETFGQPGQYLLQRVRCLHEEAAELLMDVKAGKPAGPELADVVIFAIGVADAAGLDLPSVVAEKLVALRARRYAKDTAGAWIRGEHEP